MIHHVTVEVSDLGRSGSFYDALLGPLGWRRQIEEHDVIAWGLARPVFFASTRRPAVPGTGHVCFTATGIPAVKASWEAGIEAGGSDEGGPGSRPQYGAGYYSAYLLDPDGHRVEVAVGEG